eukprot:g5624.t1
MEGVFGGSGGGCGGCGSGNGAGLGEGRIPQKAPILKFDEARTAEQQLARLRELKNSLVGDEEAKRSALALSVVQDVLTFLDAAGDGDNGGGRFYESSLLHGIGLLTISCSSPPLPKALAEVYLAPSGSRIVRHIARAMEITSLAIRRNGGGGGGSSDSSRSSSTSSSEKLTATILRALSSLCESLVPAATITFCPDGARADEPANNEQLKTLAALKGVSGVILREIVATPATTAASGIGGGGRRGLQGCWPPSLKTLGLEALAAMTRVEELARGLVQPVVSTKAVLLAPITRHRGPRGAAPASLAGRAEAAGARNIPPLLELLANLSCADQGTVASWLTSGVYDWAPGNALAGLEAELSNRDEKAQILAGLVLVSCFKGSKTAAGTGTTSPDSPPFPPSCPHPSFEPTALDEVIAHRVLPLFFRTLRLWSALPPPGGSCGDGRGHGGFGGGQQHSAAPTSSPSSPPAAAAAGSGDLPTVCGGHAAAVAAAINVSVGLGNGGGGGGAWPRQFWGELEPSSHSSRGGGVGNGREAGEPGNWDHGDFRTNGRVRSFQGGDPEPMDVVCQSGGEEEVITLATTTTSGRGAGAGVWREDTTGMGFLRLMEAVLGTLAGGGGVCDEISCAALSLLHALSAADDSQRAALRTPRVLHAALTFSTPDVAQALQQGQQHVPPAVSAAAAPTGGANIFFGAITTRSPGGRVVASTSVAGASAAITAATLPPPPPPPPLSVSANAAARMLLAELLPPRSGDGHGHITAAFAAASVSGAGPAGGVGGPAQLTGWMGGAGGQRWMRPAVAGAWCSGLDFDRATGGGVP